MKQLNMTALNTRCTSILNANSEERLQETLVNLVYQAIVHGNYNPEFMLALRNSKAPAAFRSAVGKWMPVKFDKAANAYTFDRSKVEKVRANLCLADSNEFEVFALALPNAFEKAEGSKAVDSVDKVVANVASRLGKLNVDGADNIAALVALMAARPEVVAAIAQAILKTDTLVAEGHRIAC